MSGAPGCPSCSRALPESVLTGPPQAVVRCEGCGTLLLWSHGKVVRSARSSPSTLMGLPTPNTPAPAPPKGQPAPSKLPHTLQGLPTIQPPEDDKKPQRPGAATLSKIAPPKNALENPVEKKTLVAEAPSAKTLIAAAPPEKPHIVSAMVQQPKPTAGPMEDPSDWFDDEPTRSDAPPLGEIAAPLPPLQTVMGAAKPIDKKTVADKKTLVGAPAPKLEAPSQNKTVMAPAPPLKSDTLADKKTLLPSSKLEAPTPKPEAPKPEAAQAPTVMVPAPVLPPSSGLPTLPTSTPIFESLPLAAVEPPGAMLEPVLRPAGARPAWLVPAVFGAAALLLLGGVGVLLLGAPSKEKKPIETAAAEPPAEKPVAKPAVAPPREKPAAIEKPVEKAAVEKPVAPVETPKAEPPVEKPRPVEKVAAVPVEKPIVEKSPPAEPPPPPVRRPRTLGGKKVVLEYDKTLAQKAAPPPEAPRNEDPATVERAREAYRRGNQRLFSGNSAGAVEAYRESLRIYPGYVAGYRGLGLAYAEEGNTEEALKALRTYVRTVPAANDVALIQRRIERLEKSP